MANITNGMNVFVSNSNGSSPEMVTVTAVTSTTFTAVFASTKTAGWTVKPLIAYRSLLDAYYNDVGFTVSKLAVSEINPSLPHVTLTTGSLNRVLSLSAEADRDDACAHPAG